MSDILNGVCEDANFGSYVYRVRVINEEKTVTSIKSRSSALEFLKSVRVDKEKDK